MTIGEFKKVIADLECDDNLEIKVQYSGCDVELEDGDCFKIKDFIELTNKSIYLEI